jgi:hypothetical protein
MIAKCQSQLESNVVVDGLCDEITVTTYELEANQTLEVNNGLYVKVGVIVISA